MKLSVQLGAYPMQGEEESLSLQEQLSYWIATATKAVH